MTYTFAPVREYEENSVLRHSKCHTVDYTTFIKSLHVINCRASSSVNPITPLLRSRGGGTFVVHRVSGPPRAPCTPLTLHPTTYTLHPTPCTLHPTPYTLHPAPYTPHPTPFTPYPTPCTLLNDKSLLVQHQRLPRSCPGKDEEAVQMPDLALRFHTAFLQHGWWNT